MKMESLNDLFTEELKDLYHAEKQILKALPRIAKAASTQELKDAFEEHYEETKIQVERLDRIFEQLGMPSRGKKCEGMEGILSEGDKILEEKSDPMVKDAALIASAQKVEHYEMASYGTLRTYAELLGNKEVAGILDETLQEEKETDKKLTKLATSSINRQAASKGE